MNLNFSDDDTKNETVLFSNYILREKLKDISTRTISHVVHVDLTPIYAINW